MSGTPFTSGTLLCGQYRLRDSHGGDDEAGLRFWRAHDTRVDRDVALTLLVGDPAEPNAGHAASQSLDMVRRAATLDQQAVARVLDVLSPEDLYGEADGLFGLVVADWTPGVDLLEHLRSAAEPPIWACRRLRPLVAATDQAHHFGLVTGVGDPRRIRINGQGLATLAFLAPPPGSAAHQDVQGLGGLLYLLLTGTWPGRNRPDSVPESPREPSGRLTDPGLLRDGVPRDLSLITLLSVGGSHSGGIRTCGPLLSVLDDVMQAEAATALIPKVTDSGRRHRPVPKPAEPAAFAPAAAPPPGTQTPAAQPQSAPPQSQPQPAPPQPVPARAQDQPQPALQSQPMPVHQPEPQPAQPHQVQPEPVLARSAQPQLAQPADTTHPTDLFTVAPSQPAAPERIQPAEVTMVDSPARPRPPKPRPPRVRGRRRLAVTVGALTVAAIGIAVWIGGEMNHYFTDLAGPANDIGYTTAPTSQPAGPPNAVVKQTTSTSAPPPTTTTAPPTPITPAGVSEYLVTGSADNPDQLDDVLTGSGSGWSTDQYKEQFPSYIPGIGIMLQFSQPTAVGTVTITSPSAGTTVQIRTATSPDESLSSTQQVGGGTLNPGATTIQLTASPPTQYLLVWITQLGDGGDGYETVINQITCQTAG